MVLSIMVNGLRKALEMEKAYSCGKMEANMRVTGKMIKLMDMEDLFMLMATVIMGIG